MQIAVLALQGAFLEHEQMLAKLGVESFELRQKSDLEKPFDALIIPGGESTVQGKLLRELEMYEPLKKRIEEGMPVFGTCAGLILLAKKIYNDEKVHLGTMDIVAKRNAYGRQLGSFRNFYKFAHLEKEIPFTFIRAPYIESYSENVEILATVDGKAVAAREGNQLVTAFHPELDEDLSVHSYFVNMVKEYLEK